MQFKFFVLSALASLVAASPAASTTGVATTTIASSKCKTGALQCCQTVQQANEAPASNLLGLLGIPIQGLNVPIGVTCTPISVIGVGGQNCDANPVCCDKNDFNGVVALGCTPISVGL